MTKCTPITTLAVIMIATTFVIPAHADEGVHVGGAVRFQLSYEDYNPGNRDRAGDLDLDTIRINFDGTVSNIIVSAELRYYQYMQVVHHAWVGYDFNEKWQGQLGITQVPFGNLPFNSHNFFFSSNYYFGLEDDYDFGVKFIYTGKAWSHHLAFFKNDEQGGVDGFVSQREDRYSYDVVGERATGEGLFDAPANEIGEANTLVWRGAYDLVHGSTSGNAIEVGISTLYSNLHSTTSRVGDYQALAAHVDAYIGLWNLQLTAGSYEYDLNSGRRQLVVGAYSFFDTIPARAEFYTANLAYTFNYPLPGVDSLTLYSDNSLVTQKSLGMRDTRMNILGFSLGKGALFTYFDAIWGKNQPFIGGSLAGNETRTNFRFNINVGFYF